ncbi:MAG TPA: DMT family transporter [Aestuariivirgaceae bacterium]|nr:DMT family transporter [Aestuariivirgaceae bacterium]
MLGTLALLCTATLWGSNHVVARGVNDIVPLAALVFWRWAIALAILGPLALPSMRRNAEHIRANLPDIVFIGAIGVGLFSLLLLAAAYYSLAIEVGIIYAMTPAWVAVILAVTGQARIRIAAWAGLGVSFLGTGLILTQGSLDVLLDFDVRLGNVWALLAAIVFAWFSIRLRRYSGRIEPLALTALTAAAGLALVALPVYLGSLLFAGEPILARSPEQVPTALAAIGFIALGPTLLANLLYVFGISRLGPERAATFIYVSPMASSILAIIWLGEALMWYHAAGFVLIIGGLVMVNRAAQRPAVK